MMSAFWKTARDALSKLCGTKVKSPEVLIQPTFRLSPSLNVNFGSDKVIDVPTVIKGSNTSVQSGSDLGASVGETPIAISAKEDPLNSESSSLGNKLIVWGAIVVGLGFTLYGVCCFCQQIRAYFATNHTVEVVPARASAALPARAPATTDDDAEVATSDTAEAVPGRAPAAAPGTRESCACSSSGCLPASIISIKGNVYVLTEKDKGFAKAIKLAILKAVEEAAPTGLHENGEE